MLAFGSPMLAQAISPPLITISGFAPKNDAFQITRSANFPTYKLTPISFTSHHMFVLISQMKNKHLITIYTHLNRPNIVGKPVSNCWIYRVLCNKPFNAKIVIFLYVTINRTPL